MFFHTSCSDCQRDLPLLNDYYLQHKDDSGFQMVAISRAESAESVAAYWSANNLQIPYSAQQDRSIYNLFATSIIPRIYFVSPQGRIQTITAAMPHPNSFGGFHLQHTGSAGESATLIASIEMK